MTIKELRAQTGLSQTAFAKYFEIPLRTVQDWEQGRRTPPEYLVELMAEKLKKK
jgi:DNA-binding transcriptional regulator YiaG